MKTKPTSEQVARDTEAYLARGHIVRTPASMREECKEAKYINKTYISRRNDK